MKIIVFIILLIHGGIHLLGFFKAFEWAEISPLTAEISKPIGIIWLLVTLVFLISGVLLLWQVDWWFFPAIFATLLSSFLLISYWADAKYGMVPNLIILVIIAVSYGSWHMDKMIRGETDQLFDTMDSSSGSIISEADLKYLPVSVYRWIKTTGIIGKPKIKNGRVVQKALIKMKPDQKDWYNADALQYTITETPAFIWTVDLSMMPMVQIKGRDKFKDGKGEMLIKVNSLVNVVDEKGEKIDEGTLQRFLGELVWFPSLALSPFIKWEALDDQSAKGTMTYGGTTGSGVFYFNEAGDFVKFIAMRYKGNGIDDKKFPWVLTVDGYDTFEGIKVPSHMKATWELDEGDWTWLELEIWDLQYNIATQF